MNFILQSIFVQAQRSHSEVDLIQANVRTKPVFFCLVGACLLNFHTNIKNISWLESNYNKIKLPILFPIVCFLFFFPFGSCFVGEKNGPTYWHHYCSLNRVLLVGFKGKGKGIPSKNEQPIACKQSQNNAFSKRFEEYVLWLVGWPICMEALLLWRHRASSQHEGTRQFNY